MALAFRNAASAAADGNSPRTLTINKPTGVVAGDLLIASITVEIEVTSGAAPTIAPPAGWTPIRKTTGASVYLFKETFYKVAGAGEAANYGFVVTAADYVRVTGGIEAWSGADPAAPVNVHNGQSNASSTSAVAPSVTTTVANCRVLFFVGVPSSPSSSPPAGSTEAWDKLGSLSDQRDSGHYDNADVSAGATGTRTVTLSFAAENITQTIAIRPIPPNVAPNAPILDAIPIFDADEDQLFPWAFSDPNAGDSQTAYQMIAYLVSNGSTVFDTGKVASGTEARLVAGGTLANGEDYQWKVRTWDESDVVGPYSSLGSFSTAAPPTVTITTPASDGEVISADSMLVEWSVSDPGSSGQSAYRVVVKNDLGVEQSSTGKASSISARSYEVTGLPNNSVDWAIEVTAWNGDDVASTVAVRTFDVSFTAPPVPLLTVTPEGDDGYIDLSIDNPVPEVSREVIDGVTTDTDATVTSVAADFTAADVGKAISGAGIPDDTTIASVTDEATIEMSAPATATASGVTLTIGTTEPAIASNSIYRKVQGETTWVRIATDIAEDGDFQDYTAGSGIVYEYKVSAVGDNGTAIDSAVVIDSLTLIGIWLHDPSDPAGSAQGFRATARNKQRSRTRTRAKAFHNFAGRELPVAEIGEQLAITLAVTLHVYDDATMDLLRALDERDTTLCYRDSRGRSHFGLIDSLPENDERFGYSVAFDFVATDHSEAV